MSLATPGFQSVALGALLAMLVSFAATPLWAQTAGDDGSSAYAEPSDNQIELNEEAVVAMEGADYERAVRLLEASLDLGELNVTWLNLGRAYHRLGQCNEARKAYLSVISAPAVEEPSSKLVDAKAEQYLDELDASCEQTTPSQVGEPERAQTPKSPPKDGSSGPVAWSSVGVGGALLATSGVFFALGLTEHQEVRGALDETDPQTGRVVGMSREAALERADRGDTYKTIALSTAIAGAAATGIGTFLLLRSDSPSEVSMGVSRDRWTIQWRTEF